MPFSVVPVGNQFARLFPVPIDQSFVFNTTAERTAYASSAVAYSGLVAADLQTNKVYILGSGMTWQQVGVTVNETFGAATSGMLFKTGNNTFSVGGLSSGNNILITDPSGLNGNPTIGLSSSVTGLNNLTSSNLTITSGVVTSRLAVSGLLTLNGRDITTNIEAIANTNTANFNLSVGSVTNVGSNGGPSYYGTYDQGGNVREIMHSGSTSSVAMRGGNFANLIDSDALNKSIRTSQTPTAFGPGFGFRLSSRENIGKSYSLTLNAGSNTGILVSGVSSHGFQIGDPLKFANDLGLPVGLASGVTYYVLGTGLTTFSISTTAGGGGSAVSVTGPGSSITSASSSYDYGSFVRVENSGNTADGSYGAVNYNYRIGKFEVTNDEYVEFLNAAARDDHDAGSAHYDGSVDRALYEPMMETEAPNNGISRNATFPDYYYASLRGMNKKPIVFVNYIDAARYANWLHNGKPFGERYKSCLPISNGTVTTVSLTNHGYSNGDLITFNCADGGTFTGALAKNTTYKVASASTNGFTVLTTGDANVAFAGTGSFYVRRFYNKVTNIDNGAHNLTAVNESTAIAKSATARYWISTENEWYKAAYYDPAKGGAGVPGYWTYPTRSDTMPSGISADVNGNGSYNPGGTVPSHYHSSYDISDFADRVDTLISNGDGTQAVYTPSITTGGSIGINVTGIPLSKVVDVTATASEVNYLTNIVLGSGSPSKVLSLDVNKSVSGIAVISAATGVFLSGSFSGSSSANAASTLTVGGTGVSLSGHKHVWGDVTDFCSGVANCVDTSLVASTGIQFISGASSLTLALSGQALNLHNFSGTGLITRNSAGTFTSRAITTSNNNIVISNADGVSANPIVGLNNTVTGLTSVTSDALFTSSITASKILSSGGTTLTVESNNVSVTGNLSIGGNLLVNGTGILLQSSVVVVNDPIFTLGGSGTALNDSKDRGIEFKYNDGASKVGFFGYQDSTDKFVFLKTATNTNEIFTGTKGEVDAYVDWSNITGSIPDPVITVTLTGAISGSANGTLTNLGTSPTININATIGNDQINLGTHTVGNYVASIASGSYLLGGSAGSEGAALTLSVDATENNTVSKVVARDGSGNFSAGTITATLSGLATNATQVSVVADTSDNTRYLTFVDTTSGFNAERVASGLTYNPSTGRLSATSFGGDGSALTSLNASNLSAGTVPSGRLSGVYDISATGVVPGTSGTVLQSNGVVSYWGTINGGTP